MKRSLLLTLAAAVVMSLVAIVGVRNFGGPDVASAHKGTGAVHLEIDLIKDGSTWCNPVDAINTSAPNMVGVPYQVAICLTDVQTGKGPQSIQFDLIYNKDKNECTPDTAGGNVALDDNPDFLQASLGGVEGNWDCNLSNDVPGEPKCDRDVVGDAASVGRAFLFCQNSTDEPTLPVGNNVSAPLAVVNMKAKIAGTDNLSLGYVELVDSGLLTFLACWPTGAGCLGAADSKEVPPPTPTATTVPAQCDIQATSGLVNPPSLNLKVGDDPVPVDLTGTFTNLGHVNPNAADATCTIPVIFGAMGTTAIPGVFGPVPAGIRVRMEPLAEPNPFPSPTPNPYPGGDVCLYCYQTGVGQAIGICIQGPGPASVPPAAPSTWTYTLGPCEEIDKPFDMAGFGKLTQQNNSCRDGIDNDLDLGIDWARYSPATPDVACLDTPAISLNSANRMILLPPPGASKTRTRQANIQCDARGTYNLMLFVANNGGYVGGGTQVSEYRDPNPANNQQYVPLTVTCTQGPEMVKDCDPDTEGVQTNCNLWLIDPAFEGKQLPEPLPAADANGCVIASEGKGCLAVDVWLNSAADDDDPNDSDLIPECLGAWEHQVRFDHKLIKFVNDLEPLDWDGDGVNESTSWLESTGRVANCSVNVLAENWILEGCVTTDGPAPGMQVGPCGSGIIEHMLIVPKYNDLIYRGVFRPTKDNGVVTNIVDDNCEITDIYAEPMADTLPGGLTPICGDLNITIRMLEGDIDLDCDVDVGDAQGIAFRYGSSWGLQLYDQWFDLEPKYADQDIDIKDLQFIFGRNGSTCQVPIPDDQSTPVDPGQP